MTTAIGFPPQRSAAILRAQLTELQETASQRRAEAVTGRLADPTAALNGRVGAPLAIERALGDIEGYRQTIALATTRADTAQGVIDQLRQMLDDVTNQAEIARQSGSQNGLETASALAAGFLNGAVSGLNSRIAGRSLFAGDAADMPALVDAETLRAEVVSVLQAAPDAATAEADLRVAFNTPGGLFDTTLYLGGSGDAPSAEIARDERVDYQARADEQVFRDFLRGMAVLSATYDPDVALAPADRATLLEGAIAELRNVVDPLNRIAARIGAVEGRIATVSARHTAEETALTRSYNDLTGVDSLVAATELQAIDSQLEVLFLTTARFSQLSLVNFLR